MLARGETPPIDGPEQQNLVMQLRLAMQTMHQLDEMFQWLASAFVHRFGVSLVQFWIPPGLAADRDAARLLAMVVQDPSVPERVVVTEEIRRLVERCSAARQAPLFFPLEQAFSSYQATRLNRYGFYYGGCAMLESSVPLFRLKTVPSSEAAQARVAISTLLLLKQLPAQDLLATIHVALERGMILAAGCGLAFSSAVYPFPAIPPGAPSASATSRPETSPHRAQQPVVHAAPPPQQSPQPEALPPMEELVPHRRQDPDLLMATNPFASTAAIADARARRLYAAIDGRSTLSELCSSTGMPLGEASVALQILLKQQRIEVYDPAGRPMKAALFFKSY